VNKLSENGKQFPYHRRGHCQKTQQITKILAEKTQAGARCPAEKERKYDTDTQGKLPAFRPQIPGAALH